MATRLEHLLRLGKKIHEAREQLSVNHPTWHHYATRVLSKRPGWAKTPVPDRVKLLTYVLAAETLGVLSEHGMGDVVQSYHIRYNTSTEEEQIDQAALSWDMDFRGKKEIGDLVKAVKNATRNEDAIKFRLAGGTLRVEEEDGIPASRANQLQASPSHREAAPHPDALVEAFWAPHLDQGHATVIVYGKPLFLRTPDRTQFKRLINENLRNETEAKPENRGLEGCWPFITHGEAICAVNLTRFLTAAKIQIEFVPAKAHSSLSGLGDRLPADVAHGADAIVLGGARSNGVLDGYQKTSFRDPSDDSARRFRYRLEDVDVVTIDEAGATEGEPFKDRIGDEESEVWAVVSRRPGAYTAGMITVIASNYSSVIGYFGNALTNERLLSSLLRTDPRTHEWATSRIIPEYFQILIKILIDAEDVVKRCTVEGVWPDRERVSPTLKSP